MANKRKAGRKASVRYYPTKGGYFTVYEGRRYRLASGPDDVPSGPTYLAALAEYGRIVKGEEVQGGEGDQPRETLGVVVRRWVDRKGEGTVQAKKYHSLFRDLYAKYGNRPYTDLRPCDVDAWLKSHKTWGASSRSIAVRGLKTALNWNRKKGHTTVNPLDGMEMPEDCDSRSRGAENALPDDVVNAILAAAHPRYRDYFRALYLVGARPGELANAQAFHFTTEGDGGARLVFRANPAKGYVWKNAKRKKKGSKDAVIYLPAEVVAVIERNAREGSEYLFPSPRGVKMTANAIRQALGDIADKPDVAEVLRRRGIDRSHVIAYSFRHTFATRALVKGVPVATLAVLMNTSVGMIMDHYGHLAKETAVLRGFAELVNS